MRTNQMIRSLLALAFAPVQWLFLNFFVLSAAPMRSTDFRSIVEPILNEVFDGIYEQRKGEYLQVFKERPGTPRAYHEEPVLFGFPAAPELPDGMPVSYQQGGVLYNMRYVYRVFGLAFAITKVLMEDGDHIRVGTTFSEHLAQSMVETKETLPANVINRAFNSSYLGGDGVSLVSASHPIQGGVLSNQLNTSGALSQSTVEQMLIQIRSAQDNNGKRIRLDPVKLVVSPSNIFQAEVVVKSVLRAGTSNNDLNPIRSIGLLSQETAVLSRQTSPTQWGIKIGNVQRGLQVLMRRKLEKTMEGDFETDSMRYKATERYWAWWTDWRDYWATPGT